MIATGKLYDMMITLSGFFHFVSKLCLPVSNSKKYLFFRGKQKTATKMQLYRRLRQNLRPNMIFSFFLFEFVQKK